MPGAGTGPEQALSFFLEPAAQPTSSPGQGSLWLFPRCFGPALSEILPYATYAKRSLGPALLHHTMESGLIKGG